jgi:hypothetical protein
VHHVEKSGQLDDGAEETLVIWLLLRKYDVNESYFTT